MSGEVSCASILTDEQRILPRHKRRSGTAGVHRYLTNASKSGGERVLFLFSRNLIYESPAGNFFEGSILDRVKMQSTNDESSCVLAKQTSALREKNPQLLNLSKIQLHALKHFTNANKDISDMCVTKRSSPKWSLPAFSVLCAHIIHLLHAAFLCSDFSVQSRRWKRMKSDIVYWGQKLRAVIQAITITLACAQWSMSSAKITEPESTPSCYSPVNSVKFCF